ADALRALVGFSGAVAHADRPSLRGSNGLGNGEFHARELDRRPPSGLVPHMDGEKGSARMTDVSMFKPNTVYVTYIAATPERVWQALTDPAFTRQYFFGLTVDVESRAGGIFRLLL